MMEGNAINDLLVDIPRQASSIAVSCAEQIIEGQIHNPTGFAKNIKRIASKLYEWNTSGVIDEAGDGSSKSWIGQRKGEIRKGLISLPQEVRCKIWSLLDSKDMLNVRLVCKAARDDIDHDVGLPVILDTSSDSFTWVRSVTVRECWIKLLDNQCYINFLSRPECMQKLTINSEVFIPSDYADLILRKFPALKYFSMFTKEFLEVSDDGTQLVEVTPTVTSEMFEIISKKPLIKMTMSFIDSINATKWIMELSPAQKNSTPTSKSLEMCVPRKHLTINQQKDCIMMLRKEKKDSIHELKCNLENMNWKYYEEPLQNNSRTLTGLYLQNLSLNRGEFDCNILGKCEYLRVLALSGRADHVERRLLKIVNLHQISLRRLSIFDLENVYIPIEEFSYIEKNMEKTVWIKLRSSQCGQDFYIGLHLGRKASQIGPSLDTTTSREIMYRPISDFRYKTYKSDSNFCKHDCPTDEMCICESCGAHEDSSVVFYLNPQLISGLLLTAYLALC